ncbi:hypothetical protein WJX81_003339 [Elliptochloris bilobata]|uniref:Myb-like domain-containing protein n=1 Tax=Elliptochloris bilobata TaxID=381761 RepID=A0AAW1RWE5_9CHLO
MEMRAKFSPQRMLAEDGSINQEFFKPKTLVIVEDKKWGDAERDLLYKGIEKYGIGKWNEISAELLPKWDDQAIRVKASRLMGSQSLARYVAWKGNKAAVDAEYAANKALGERLGCWKAGALVEDNAGSVKKALAAAGRGAGGAALL